MGENDIKLTVSLPDGRKTEITEDYFNTNQDKIFQKFPGAKIIRTQVYNQDDNDIVDSDTFGVALPDGRTTTLTGSYFSQNRDKIMQKFPEARIVKVSDMSDRYWRPSLDEAQASLDALNREQGGFMNEYESRKELADTLDADGVVNSDIHDYINSHAAEYATLSQQRETLRKSIATNPITIEGINRAYERASRLHDEYKAHIESASTGSERRDWRRAAKLQRDAMKVLSAPSKYNKEEDGPDGFMEYMSAYAKGAGATFSDRDFWTRGISAISRNFDLYGISKKIHEAEAKLGRTLTEQDYDNILSPSEKAEIFSAWDLANAQAKRAIDIASAYNAGQGFADSLGYMAEFILSQGVANAVGGGIKALGMKGLAQSSNGFVKWLGQSLMSERALNRAIEKQAVEAIEMGTARKIAHNVITKPVIQGLWHTLTQPSTLVNISEKMLGTNDAGELNSIGRGILLGLGDSWVENWSESFGNAMDFGGEQIGTWLGGKLGGTSIAKTGFGRWARWFHNAPIMQLAREAGFNGFVGEMAEEWAGNAVRVMFGLMTPEEFKNFASIKQQAEMAASFAPMSLFSLGGGAINAKYHRDKYKGLVSESQSRLKERGFSDEAINELFETKYDTPEDIAKKLAPVMEQIWQDGHASVATKEDRAKAQEDYALMLELATELSADSFLNETERLAKEQDKKTMRDVITGTAGEFWQQSSPAEGEESAQPTVSVREIVYADGHRVFITGSMDGQNTFVDENGKKGFLSDKDIQDGIDNETIVSDNTYGMDEYLQRRVDDESTRKESTRMERERAEGIAAIRAQLHSNPVVPMGTVEAPVDGMVVAESAAGVTVQWTPQNGATQQRNMTWSEVGNAIGLPLDVKTDTEIEQANATALAEGKKRKEMYSNITSGTEVHVLIPLDGENPTPVSRRFVRAEVDESEGGAVRIYVEDEEGNVDWHFDDDVADIAEVAAAAAEKNINDNVPVKGDNEAPAQEPAESPSEKYTDTETGRVDEKSFWNEDPEGWAAWNDSRPESERTYQTQQFIAARMETLEEEISKLNDEISAEAKSADPFSGAVQEKKDAIAEKTRRLGRLGALLSKYSTPAERAVAMESPAEETAQEPEPEQAPEQPEAPAAKAEQPSAADELRDAYRSGSKKRIEAAQKKIADAINSSIDRKDLSKTKQQATKAMQKAKPNSAEYMMQKFIADTIAARQQALKKLTSGKKSDLRYVKENAALGEYLSPYDYVLRSIMTGAVRFNWNDSKDGSRRGIANALGWAGKTSEMRSRIALLGGERAMYYDEAIHELFEGWIAESHNDEYDNIDEIRTAVDDVLRLGTPSAMLAEAQSMKREVDDPNQGYTDEELALMQEAYEYGFENVADYLAYREAEDAYEEERVREKFPEDFDENDFYTTLAEQYQQEDYERGTAETSRPDLGDAHEAVSGNERLSEDGQRGNPVGEGEQEGGYSEQGEVSGQPEQGEGVDKLASGSLSAASIQEESGEQQVDSSELEAEEGTPGNYHFNEAGVCTNPTIITLPGEDRLGRTTKIALAERDGKWYQTVYVTSDSERSAWGQAVPTVSSSSLAYPSREAAMNGAVKYVNFLLDNPAKKMEAQGETFANAKKFLDHVRKQENARVAKAKREKSGQMKSKQPKPAPQEPAENKPLSPHEEARRQRPLIARCAKWKKVLGDDSFVVLTSMEDIKAIKEKAARDKALKEMESSKVHGWYDVGSDKAYLYLPNITDTDMLDRKIMHEVLTHKGLRGALTREGYEKLCLDVYANLMTPAQRAHYLEYIDAQDDSVENRYRAADEFLAANAENRTGVVDIIDSNFWTKLANILKNIINEMAGQDIFQTEKKSDWFDAELEKSLKAFSKKVRSGKVDNSRPDAADIALSKEGTVMFSKEDGTLMAVHNISAEKLAKAARTGGLANPSAAVFDIGRQEHSDYGEISLILPSSMVATKTGRNGGVYTGNAWTPTYPPTVRKMSDKGWQEYERQIIALPQEVRSDVDMYFRDDIDREMTHDATMWWFLHDTGRNPAIAHHHTDYSEEMVREFNEIGQDGVLGILNNPELLHRGIEFFRKYAPTEEVESATKIIEPRPNATQRAIDTINEWNEQVRTYGARLSPVTRFLDTVEHNIAQEGKYYRYATFSAARETVEADGLMDEFKAWTEKKADEFDIQEKIFVGFDNNGNRKYLDNTVKNASRLMNREAPTNSYSDNTVGAIRSSLFEMLHTLDEIRERKDRIVSDAEYQLAYDVAQDELGNVISELSDKQKISDNPFSNFDYAASRLGVAIAERNPVEYLNSEYGYHIAEAGEFATAITHVKETLRRMPSKYFELKFNRPVYLNEFAAAVIPEDASEKTVKILTDAGVPIYKYKRDSGGKTTSRREAVISAAEEAGNVLFSKSVDDISTLFDLDLDKQMAGEYDGPGRGHTYELGFPSKILLSTGIPNLPIQLQSSTINMKSNDPNHPFDIADLKGLVKAIQKPWAIFEYGDKNKAQNLMVGISKGNKHFLVGIHIEPVTGSGLTLNINSIRGLFPKDNHEWLNWIQEGKALRIDEKTKIQALISVLGINPLDYPHLDLNYVTKVVKNFKNPKLPDDVQFSKAYHGSGAEFGEFDSSHMGEGEGAQAHGWGHYVAFNIPTAIQYATASGTDMTEHTEVVKRMNELSQRYRDALYKFMHDREAYDKEFGGKQALTEMQKERERLEQLLRVADKPVRPKNFPWDASLNDIFAYQAATFHLSEYGWDYTVALKDSEKYETMLPHVKKGIDMVVNSSKDDWTFSRHFYHVNIPDDIGTNYIHEDELVPMEEVEAIHDELKRRMEGEGEEAEFLKQQASEIEKVFDDLSHNANWGNNVYDGLVSILNSKEKASKLLSDMGYVGISYYGRQDGHCAVIFKDEDIQITDSIVFSKENQTQNGFISNAEAALDEIQMQKATPQQWLKMLESKGGLKAGEDKWLGLSDWLSSQTRKTITKDEIGEYIAEHRIQIEEKQYAEDYGYGSRKWYDILKEEYPGAEEYINFWAEPGHSGFEFIDELGVSQMYNVEHPDNPIRLHDGGYFTDEDHKTLYRFMREIAEHVDDIYRQRYDASVERIHPTRKHYTTPELDSYHEIALTVPTVGKWNQFDDIHFGDAGSGRAIGWIRFGTTSLPGDLMTEEEKKTLPESYRDRDIRWKDKPVLVIDEIQSKRHQEGREHGYWNSPEEWRAADALRKAQDELQEVISRLSDKYGVYALEDKYSPEDHAEYQKYYNAAVEADRKLQAERVKVSNDTRAVPAAPFEKNWHELAMKRMLRYAAENGYEYIAWTTGDQQTERYNIGGLVRDIEREDSNNIDELNFCIYLNNNGGSQHITTDKEGNVKYTLVEEFRGKNLTDIVGKEIATKMLGLIEGEVIDGDGLRIGGEGMKGFYDRILPAFMNKYGKKWGVKVEDIFLPRAGYGGVTMHSVPVTKEMKETVMQGQLMFSKEAEEAEAANMLFSKVTDRKTLDKLALWPTMKVYRAMALIDGKLYPPMSTKEPNAKGERGKKLQMRPASEFGVWEQSDEAPEKAYQGKDGKWYFDLKKSNGKDVNGVLYNPYFHTSLSPLNDQFSGAWQRPELVVVEVEIPVIPEDDEQHDYKAEKANDAVGPKEWHSGTVTAQLGEGRQVILSRWARPVRIVPESEIADIVAPKLIEKGVAVPYNVITPALRAELEKKGVTIEGDVVFSKNDLERDGYLHADAFDIAPFQNRLDAINARIASEGASSELNAEKVALFEEYFDKVATSDMKTHFCQLPELKDYLVEHGFDEQEASGIVASYSEPFFVGEFNQKADVAIFLAERVPSIDYLRQEFVHERQHMRRIQNGGRQLLVEVANAFGYQNSAQEARARLETAVEDLSGSGGAYGHDIGTLADEFLAYAMQHKYSDKNFENTLKKYYIADEAIEIINRLYDEGRRSYISRDESEDGLIHDGLSESAPGGDLEASVQGQSGEVSGRSDAEENDGGHQGRGSEGESRQSNLTPAQLRMVSTSAFKRWFKKSKIVDENGEPAVVYHGSRWDPMQEAPGNAVFKDSFRGTGSGDNGFFGRGFYFTFGNGEGSRKEARYYGRHVTEAFLSIQNPFMFNETLEEFNGKHNAGAEQHSAEIINMVRHFPELCKEFALDVYDGGTGDFVKEISLEEYAKRFDEIYKNKEFIINEGIDSRDSNIIEVCADPVVHTATTATGQSFDWTDYKFRIQMYRPSAHEDARLAYTHFYLTYENDFSRDDHRDEVVMVPSGLFHDLFESEEFTQALKDRGYDGVMQSAEGDEVVAFYPNQIKSATGNNGDFDPTNPDIRFSKAYHGTSADFNEFDSSHIGEGEGHQSHGWGHYVSLSDQTAKRYTLIGDRDKIVYHGAPAPTYYAGEIVEFIKQEMAKGKSFEDSRAGMLDMLVKVEESRKNSGDTYWMNTTYAKEIKFVEGLTKDDFEVRDVKHILYTVDIPDDNGENYIDEQKELTKAQRKTIAEALRSLPDGVWKTTEDDSVLFGYPTASSLANKLSRRLLNGYEIYAELVHGLGSKQAASQFLSDAGFVGIKYKGGVDGPCAVIFNDKDLSISEQVQFSKENRTQLGFVSNAEAAVEQIPMGKATPQQWIKMLEGKGGLKAGEDKWMGLSDWLRSSDKKTVTREEVMEFIREHRIQIEETHYASDNDYDDVIEGAMQPFRDEFDELVTEGEEETGSIYTSDWVDWAWQQMVDRYSDDFTMGFEVDGSGTAATLVPQRDVDGKLSGAARYFLGLSDSGDYNPINDTRMEYTTAGLENKHEIALTVPTIQSWGASDTIHFGDADDGRAIAWVRFGDTTIGPKRILVIDEIQSKRHQQGREKGYESEEHRALMEEAKKKQDEAESAYYNYQHDLAQKYDSIVDEATKEEKAERNRLMEEMRRAQTVVNLKGFNPRTDERYLELEARLKAHDSDKHLHELYDEWSEVREEINNHSLQMNDELAAALRTKSEREEMEEKARQLQLRREKVEEELRPYQTARKEITAEMDKLEHELRKQFLKKYPSEAIPAAPFEKNWHELAMKRMLRYAAENGYDVVSWTTGNQQAERYDLGQVISSITRQDNSEVYEGKRFILQGAEKISMAVDEEGKIAVSSMEELEDKMLADVVGKGVAQKMMDMNEGDVLDSEEMRIGDEGMKGFYDDILPRFMNKYGKKWGVKVEDMELPQIYDGIGHPLVVHSVPVTKEMKESVMQGQVMFSKGKANIDAGLNALEKIAAGEDMVKNAMSRADISRYGADTSISFYWGKPGNQDKGFKKGYGLSHIGAKHGAEAIIRAITVIDHGVIDRYVNGNKTIVLTDGEYEALLALTMNGDRETWLFNGWEKKEKAGETGEVSAQSSPTQTSPMFSREDLGAAISEYKGTKKYDNAILDADYLAAVEAGDMETAARLVEQAAAAAGYNSSSDYQGSLAFNGAAPERNGYFETRDERKEAFDNGDFEGTYSLGDFVSVGLDGNDLEWQLANPIAASARDKATLASIRNLNAAIKSGKGTITMYRAVDGSIKEDSFRNGDWVTPSREYAERHIGLQSWKSGRVIEQEVSIDDIWWNGDDINEWGYDDGKGYVYKNTRNNRKLLDTVTYDDNGNIIPLSKRFNERKADVRFSKGDIIIDNIVIKADDNPFTTEDEVKTYLGKGGKVFHNVRDNVDIRVSIKGINHRAPRHRKEIYMAVTKMEQIVGSAVNIGQLPVAPDEIGKTKSVNVFYAPVNILGKQYSARMIIKEYERFGRVIEELGLYNIALGKQKTPSPYDSTSNEGDVFYEGVKSAYKVKELIHKKQTHDQKILGLTDDTALLFSKKTPGVFSPEAEQARKMLGDGVRMPEPMSKLEIVRRVQDGGIAALIGKDDAKAFYDSVIRIVPDDMVQMIVDRTIFLKDKEGNEPTMDIRATMRSVLGELADKGYEADTTGLLRAAADRLAIQIDSDGPLDYDTLRYLIWRDSYRYSYGDVVAMAKDQKMRKLLNTEPSAEESIFGHPEQAMEEYEERNKEAAYDRAKKRTKAQKAAVSSRTLEEAVEAVALSMSAQREYDKATVDSVVKLAKRMIREGNIKEMTAYQAGRLINIVSRATGAGGAALTRHADRLMDFIVDHAISVEKKFLEKLTKVKAVKVKEPGVDVQAKLDVEGQTVVLTFADWMNSTKEQIQGRINKLQDNLDDIRFSDKRKEEMRLELAGLSLAMRYADTITASEVEEENLRQELKDGNLGAGLSFTEKERKAILDAIRETKIERVKAYRELSSDLADVISDSSDRALSFLEKEQERIEHIHHLANADLEGIDADPIAPDETPMSSFNNNSMVRFFASPLVTFDQMLRIFGRRHTNGEGYLYNYFMKKWRTATDSEFMGKKEANARLDAKVKEIFGKEASTWGDLYELEKTLPTYTCKFLSNGEPVEHELSQGNMLYISMVDRMADGRMKLDAMGIDEEMVAQMRRHIDPRFMELADWMQGEYLTELRDKYNEIHKRMFGTSMAAIENYFPLKITGGVIDEEIDLNNPENETLPSSMTGAIIKRTKNTKQLDITHADAFSVMLEHVNQMEHWAAFAEFNRDLGTLLSYKRFKNQLNHMDTAAGSGKKLWSNFRKVAVIAAGEYRPEHTDVDKGVVNIAKGVSTAKISFRVYTALKQMLSAPAFLSDANWGLLLKSMATPVASWKWAMENIPSVQSRWESKQAGNEILQDTELDWKVWKQKLVQLASRYGMTPNALVDVVTVSIGAKAIYDTKKAEYLKDGFSEEKADEKAKFDAATLVNETQQSSEAAFLSPMQVDRTAVSVALSVFRNSSFGYTRQMVHGIRMCSRMLKDGYREQSIEFMAKQMERDGLTPEQAQHAAERRYGKAFTKNLFRVVNFGFISELTWNLGAYLAYILFGDDPDKKIEMLADASRHALVGGFMEGFAGGSIASEIANRLWSGQSIRDYDPNLLPVVQDLKNIGKRIGSDPVSGANDVINLLFQIGTGVNLQTITDAGVAIVDACGGDFDTATEALLLISRILQVPQSQQDQFMIDELGISAAEAKTLPYDEIAERYARYKIRRGAPLTGWAYTDELEEKREKAYLKRFDKLAKEREDLHSEDFD